MSGITNKEEMDYDGEASTTLNQAPKLPTGGTQILSLFLSLILT